MVNGLIKHVTVGSAGYRKILAVAARMLPLCASCTLRSPKIANYAHREGWSFQQPDTCTVQNSCNSNN